MDEQKLKNWLLEYAFMDESKNYIVVLDKQKIQKLFGTDYILLEETEHR